MGQRSQNEIGSGHSKRVRAQHSEVPGRRGAPGLEQEQLLPAVTLIPGSLLKATGLLSREWARDVIFVQTLLQSPSLGVLLLLLSDGLKLTVPLLQAPTYSSDIGPELPPPTTPIVFIASRDEETMGSSKCLVTLLLLIAFTSCDCVCVKPEDNAHRMSSMQSPTALSRWPSSKATWC